MKEKLATNWHLMNMIECRFNNLQLLRHCFISFSSLTYRRSSNSDDCFDSDSDSNTQHIREIIPIIITLIDYSINCISTGVGGLFRVSMKLSIVWFTSTAAWKDWNICAHSEWTTTRLQNNSELIFVYAEEKLQMKIRWRFELSNRKVDLELCSIENIFTSRNIFFFN